jgi:16S rRNA processing protein RimM
MFWRNFKFKYKIELILFVPFFIEEYRFRSDTTALVKLERVDTSEQARKFTNVEVYYPKKYVEEDDSDDIPTWKYFVGFQVLDINHGNLGEIVNVDESTMNVLFAIEQEDGEEILLPAHEEFILKIEKKKRVITVAVPEGLLD